MSGELPSKPTGRAREPVRQDSEVDAFLAAVNAAPRPERGRGRLLFALDATASREPTWDMACHLQADMFGIAAGLGGVAIQVAFYRGYSEFRASPFIADARRLQRMMGTVRCLAGRTQIGRVLGHAARQAEGAGIGALVFVGDCVEEDIDELGHAAGALGLLGVPGFFFQEGDEPTATRAFRQLAMLTGGAHCAFNQGSADQLRALLRAVAVYAAGGHRALEDHGRREGGQVLRLTHQLRKG